MANGNIKIRWSMVKAQNVYGEKYKHLLDMGHRFGEELSSNQYKTETGSFMWIYIHSWKRNHLEALLLRTLAVREGKEKIEYWIKKGFFN